MKKHLLFMVKLFKYIFIYLAIFIFIFIIGEVFSSVYEYGKFKREGTKYNLFYKVPYLEHRLRPDFKGDYENALVKINSLGFRSREISLNKPKDIFRIICIGESTTFGLGASSNVHTYPALLEGKLNSRINNPKLKIEVINAGIPSYDSSQCYILLGLEMMALDPDLIVIYTGWNEMGRSLRKGWNDDYRYSFRYRQFKEKQKSYLEFSNVKSFVSNSHFVKRLLRTKSKIRRSLGRKFNISWLQPKVRLPDYLESDEVNIDAIGLWTNNIKNMIALAEAKGAETILFTWPQFLNVSGRYSKEEINANIPKKILILGTVFEKTWMKAYSLYQQQLIEIAEESNVHLFDAAEAFLELDNLPLYYDEIHLTDKGNAVLAEGLANFILQNIDFPKSKD